MLLLGVGAGSVLTLTATILYSPPPAGEDRVALTVDADVAHGDVGGRVVCLSRLVGESEP